MQKKIELRHTTPHQTYRRCGLTLTRRWQEAQVDEAELAFLEADTWVEIRGTAEPESLEKSEYGKGQKPQKGKKG